MQKAQTWIVVANSTIAKIFSVEKVGVLTELEMMENPQGHLREKDLRADSTNHSFENSGGSNRSHRHSYEPKVSLHDQEVNKFAKNIADRLEQERQHGSFQKLYISASPIFLSALRQNLHPHTLKVIVEDLNKDMTHMPPSEIWNHISQGRF